MLHLLSNDNCVNSHIAVLLTLNLLKKTKKKHDFAHFQFQSLQATGKSYLFTWPLRYLQQCM